MGITSLQARMDSLYWLQQGSISEENAGLMDSNTLVGNPAVWPHDPDILLCGRPPATRRLPPHHDQALKCPRCDSAHTKFCYYNNYSLSQPRYFCKTCRRYWTKGGTLRNIPVGGGCRKNKKASSNPKKTPSTSSHSSVSLAAAQDPTGHRRPGPSPPPVLDSESTNLQLAFPEQLSLSVGHVPVLFNPMSTGLFFDDVFMGMQQNPGGNNDFTGIGVNNHEFGTLSLEGGIDNPGEGLSIMESCQRLMLPYNENNYPSYNNNSNHLHHHEVDVKPKVLSMEWHDCNSGAGIRDPFGYNMGGLGSWAGLMNGYGPSAMNPLV